jgi:hypothetical protein
LDNNEKEMLAKDISLDEISKVIKILKPYQSVVKNCSSSCNENDPKKLQTAFLPIYNKIHSI